MKTNITHAAIILADVPYNEHNPRQCMGKHYYILISNNACCRTSPVLQAIPTSSNTNRRLPVQVEVHAECFSRRTFALAELSCPAKSWNEENIVDSLEMRAYHD